MKPFRKEAQFILMFFVFLTVFTIFSNFGIESEVASAKSLQAISNEIVNVKPSLLREPASISDDITTMINEEFLCNLKDSPKQNKVNKRLVMVSFKICKDLKNFSSVTLENQSNGFKAQIFKLEKNKYKTDYIQLNEGLNQLRLEAVLKDGQKLEESLEILSGS